MRRPHAFPPGNVLAPALAGAYFAHCASVVLPCRPPSALHAYRALMALSPGWLRRAMAVRNRLMRWLGMKGLGGLASTGDAADPQPGDRVGIFTLLAATPDQVVLGDRDRHLGVSLSLQLRDEASQVRLYCATVVERPNCFGRLYMLPVAQVHRLVVPLMLRRLARQLRGHPSGGSSQDPCSRSPA